MQKYHKALTEYVPLIGFFLSYWLYNLNIATAILIVLTVIAVIFSRLHLGKFPLIPMITASLVLFFGGLTLLFDDPRFIKMKPTIVQAALALLLMISAYINKPVLQMMMGQQIVMKALYWRRLSYRYGIFFLAMAALNEYIWRNFSTDFWVNFKFFGLTGLTLVFSITQIVFIMRHNENNSSSGA